MSKAQIEKASIVYDLAELKMASTEFDKITENRFDLHFSIAASCHDSGGCLSVGTLFSLLSHLC